jgi:hypothetical protein
LEEVRGFVAVGIENRVERVVLHRVTSDNGLVLPLWIVDNLIEIS